MKNVKLLAAAGMLSLVSFASFAQPVSVTADTLDNAEAKIAAIAKTRASLITLPKRIPVTRFI